MQYTRYLQGLSCTHLAHNELESIELVMSVLHLLILEPHVNLTW